MELVPVVPVSGVDSCCRATGSSSMAEIPWVGKVRGQEAEVERSTCVGVLCRGLEHEQGLCYTTHPPPHYTCSHSADRVVTTPPSCHKHHGFLSTRAHSSYTLATTPPLSRSSYLLLTFLSTSPTRLLSTPLPPCTHCLFL